LAPYTVHGENPSAKKQASLKMPVRLTLKEKSAKRRGGDDIGFILCRWCDSEEYEFIDNLGELVLNCSRCGKSIVSDDFSERFVYYYEYRFG